MAAVADGPAVRCYLFDRLKHCRSLAAPMQAAVSKTGCGISEPVFCRQLQLGGIPGGTIFIVTFTQEKLAADIDPRRR